MKEFNAFKKRSAATPVVDTRKRPSAVPGMNDFDMSVCYIPGIVDSLGLDRKDHLSSTIKLDFFSSSR